MTEKRDAVLFRLMTIGEAARSLSETFRSTHDDLPWRRMIGFRNVVVHEYFAVSGPPSGASHRSRSHPTEAHSADL